VNRMGVVVLAPKSCRLSREAAVDLVGHDLVEDAAGLGCLRTAPSLTVHWSRAWAVAIEVAVVRRSYAAVPEEVILSPLERL